MSFTQTSGERCEVARTAYDELAELENAYIQSVPFRLQHLAVKYFAILKMRLQWRWKWEHIAQTVGLDRGHCMRIFRKTKGDLQALGTSISPARPRLLDLPDGFDDELDVDG